MPKWLRVSIPAAQDQRQSNLPLGPWSPTSCAASEPGSRLTNTPGTSHYGSQNPNFNDTLSQIRTKETAASRPHCTEHPTPNNPPNWNSWRLDKWGKIHEISWDEIWIQADMHFSNFISCQGETRYLRDLTPWTQKLQSHSSHHRTQPHQLHRALIWWRHTALSQCSMQPPQRPQTMVPHILQTPKFTAQDIVNPWRVQHPQSLAHTLISRSEMAHSGCRATDGADTSHALSNTLCDVTTKGMDT